MKALPRHERKAARIEIIPLIDVIFFLLATFVLVSLSLTKQPGVKVALPIAETGQAHELAEAVTVTIGRQGALHWDQDEIAWDNFLIRLLRYGEESRMAGKTPRLLLNADRQAPFGQVAVVLDEIRKAGIQKLTIETQAGPAA